jgi:hypothetical protein
MNQRRSFINPLAEMSDNSIAAAPKSQAIAAAHSITSSAR